MRNKQLGIKNNHNQLGIKKKNYKPDVWKVAGTGLASEMYTKRGLGAPTDSTVMAARLLGAVLQVNLCSFW